MIYVHIIKVHY